MFRIATLTATFALTLSTTFAAHAQAPAATTPTVADPPARFAVLVAPLAIGVGAAIGIVNAGVELQAAFNDRIGISIAPEAAYYSLSSTSVYGAGLTFGLNISLSNRKLSGWYLRPFAGVAYATGSSSASGSKASLSASQFGAELGYSWTWAPGLIMNLGGGVRYIAYLDSTNISAENKVYPRINWSIGYGW